MTAVCNFSDVMLFQKFKTSLFVLSPRLGSIRVVRYQWYLINCDLFFAIDVSKFKAVNNKSKNHTPSKVQFQIYCVEKSIQKYLSKMDIKDENEKESSNTVSASKLAAALDWA